MTNPENVTDSAETEVFGQSNTTDSESSKNFTFDKNDDYSKEDRAHILVRGVAESYQQYFIIFIEIKPELQEQALENLVVLAGEDRKIIEQIDVEESPDLVLDQIYRALNSLGDTDLKDAQNLKRNLEGLLSEPNRIEKLVDNLADADLDEFKTNLSNIIREEIFPGTRINKGIRIVSVPEEETSDTDKSDIADQLGGAFDAREESDDEEGDSPDILQVLPEYDPIDGVALREFRAGDSFDVRVTGNSVNQLKTSFLEGEDPEDADRSKLFKVKLLKKENMPLDGVDKYSVKLSNDVFGEFIADPSSRVKIRSYDDVSFIIKFKRIFFYVMTGALIFLFSSCLTVFFFPEPVIDLIKYISTQ